LKHGGSGAMTRMGAVLSGPLPAALRVTSRFASKNRANSLRRWAALGAIVGSFLTRVAWLRAGAASAKDWRAPLEARSAESCQDR
jgi:hypothetical protein